VRKFPKKTLIFVGIIVALCAAIITIAPSFIDEEKIRTEAQAYMKQMFGQDVIIRGVEVTAGLNPTVILSDISVKNDVNAMSDKLLSIHDISIKMNLMNVLQGNQSPASITLNTPVLYVDEIDKGRYNIEVAAYLKKISGAKSSGTLIMRDGRIRVSAIGSEQPTDISNINGKIAVNNTISIDTAFQLDGKDFSFVVADEGTGGGASLRNVSASLKRNEEFIAYKGTLDIAAFEQMQGAITLNIKDMKQWGGLMDMSATREKLHDVLDTSHTIKGEFPLNYRKNAMVFGSKNATLDDAPFTVQGQAAFGVIDQFKLNVHFKAVDFTSVDTDFSSDSTNAIIKRFLPADVVGAINITADSLSYGKIAATNAIINATLHESELVINQANAKMAGNSEVIFFGIVKSNINNVVNLDGNIEVLGSDIETFISALDLDEHKLLANHKGKFRAKANMYLSPAQSTISGIRFQAGDFTVQAGLEYKATADPQFIISSQVRGGNFDSMARYINPARSDSVLDSDYDTPKITLPWLDNMKNSYKITVLVDDYLMFGMKGEASRMVIEIGPGEMLLESVDLNLSDLQFTGTVSFNQEDALPFIKTDIFLSKFDTKSLQEKPLRQYPVKRGNVLSVWDNEPLGISFLKGYNGDFKIRMNKFLHRGFEFENVNFKGKVNDAVWDVENVEADMWSGSFNVKGIFNVASILSAKIEFQLKEVLLHEMLSSTLNINGVRGKMNMSGNLETAGVSANNLVDNMSANIAVYGDEVIIEGFDMAGLIQALPSVRSTSEVANTSRVALVGGKTTFKVIEGAFYITDGVIKTHGLTMRSKHAIGSLTGTIDLLSWMMDMMINFRLPTIAITQFPEVNLYFKDSVDDPLMQIDTRNLESFITKRKMNR
jgi:AsmA-like C-terminal region